MAEFPALPIWTDAYMLDCGHLSDAEHGRYFLLLMLIWRSPGCRIPNDPVWIARKLARSIERYTEEVAPLVAEFCKNDGNYITSKRLTEEFNFLEKQRLQRTVAANARWGKDKKDASASSPHTSPHRSRNAPTPTPTPIRKEDTPYLPKDRRGTRLSPDFVPDQSCQQVAEKLGMDRMAGAEALENFMDYWKGVPGAKGVKLDWQATFRNWLRNDYNRKGKTNGKSPKLNSVDRAAAGVAAKLQEQWRKEDEAAGIGGQDEGPVQSVPRLRQVN